MLLEPSLRKLTRAELSLLNGFFTGAGKGANLLDSKQVLKETDLFQQFDCEKSPNIGFIKMKVKDFDFITVVLVDCDKNAVMQQFFNNGVPKENLKIEVVDRGSNEVVFSGEAKASVDGGDLALASCGFVVKDIIKSDGKVKINVVDCGNAGAVVVSENFDLNLQKEEPPAI